MVLLPMSRLFREWVAATLAGRVTSNEGGSLLASGAPETAEHKAAVKELGEAAARREAETGDAGAFREGEALDRILRYRSAHERSLARSLDALARLPT
jgi:hypothetical protein